MWLYGLVHPSFWGLVGITLGMTHVTIAGVTIFLHRSQAHRSVKLHAVVNHFFRLWLWLTTGMETKQWVAIHRKHHASCEVEGDPHSPKLAGIKTVLFKGAELYREAGKDAEMLEKYGQGTPDDWLERHVYTPYSSKGIFLMLGADLLLFGIPGITIWAIQMMWIPFFAAGVINGIGHFFGYRNYETPDASTNIVPFGILIGGEELHNNHHTFAASAKLSSKWWEFDIGWMYICILQAVGLAKVRETSKLSVDAGKAQVDAETLRALVTHRFQLMDRYWRDVVLPVFQEEKHRMSTEDQSVFRRARKLLVREDVVMTPSRRDRLTKLLASNATLKTVYEYRLALQALWERGTGQHGEALPSLQEWCRKAEATGISVLHDFSVSLKSYVVTS